MQKHLDTLLGVIDAEIAKHPVKHLGLKWCALSQAELAERMDVPQITAERTLKTDKVMKFVHRPNGKPVRLLRRNDGKTTADYRLVRDQRIMKAEYLKARDAAGRKKIKGVPPKAYGKLKEICLIWPEEHRVACFRHFMDRDNWRVFMSSYKLAAMATDAYPHAKAGRFYRHPNIFALADGAAIAKTLYLDHLEYKAMQTIVA